MALVTGLALVSDRALGLALATEWARASETARVLAKALKERD